MIPNSINPLFSRFWRKQQTQRQISKAAQKVKMLEQVAIVEEPILPYQQGKVRYQGNCWKAIADQDIRIDPPKRVLVVGRENITLLVRPFSMPEKPVIALNRNRLSLERKPQAHFRTFFAGLVVILLLLWLLDSIHQSEPSTTVPNEVELEQRLGDRKPLDFELPPVED
ncbi:MAG: NfeD family protein [Cyanobacteria bacterium P01_A01_bin.123]